MWDIPGPGGFAVGHALIAAEKSHPDFDAWDVPDDLGNTPAHIAAYQGYRFPEAFDGWGLIDGQGKTVAQIMAEFGHPDLLRVTDYDKESMERTSRDG
jgi:ankyrin repeat protein